MRRTGDLHRAARRGVVLSAVVVLGTCATAQANEVRADAGAHMRGLEVTATPSGDFALERAVSGNPVSGGFVRSFDLGDDATCDVHLYATTFGRRVDGTLEVHDDVVRYTQNANRRFLRFVARAPVSAGGTSYVGALSAGTPRPGGAGPSARGLAMLPAGRRTGVRQVLLLATASTSIRATTDVPLGQPLPFTPAKEAQCLGIGRSHTGVALRQLLRSAVVRASR